MARIGFYPGSFDPVTYGHLDIIARSARLVDKLVLGVGVHHGKQALIDAETRISLLEQVTRPIAEHTGVKIASRPSMAWPSMRRAAIMPA